LVLNCEKKILADRYSYLTENKDLTAASSKFHNLHVRKDVKYAVMVISNNARLTGQFTGKGFPTHMYFAFQFTVGLAQKGHYQCQLI